MVNAIHVCSLSRLEQTVQETGARYVITAINPWSIPETPASVYDDNHLRLAINDIVAPHRDLVHPETQHMSELVEFARRWNRDGPLVVHCLAGISRSSASAFIVACALNETVSEYTIAATMREASATAQPNPLMVTLADQVLNRDGRMIAAIKAIGSGAAATEADTFSIPSCY